MARIEAIQFNGLESYQEIVQWMKESGDTTALAGETQYLTNIMAFPGATGFECVRPGEWVVRDKIKNTFSVAKIERA